MEQASYWRPLKAAALTAGGIGTAAFGLSAANPLLSFAGLCIAFASVPGAVRGLVDARTVEEELAPLETKITSLGEEIEGLERSPKIVARRHGGSPATLSLGSAAAGWRSRGEWASLG